MISRSARGVVSNARVDEDSNEALRILRGEDRSQSRPRSNSSGSYRDLVGELVRDGYRLAVPKGLLRQLTE